MPNRGEERFMADVSDILEPHVGSVLDNDRAASIARNILAHNELGARVDPGEFLVPYIGKPLTPVVATGISREVSWEAVSKS
jgi:hypothetical protein